MPDFEATKYHEGQKRYNPQPEQPTSSRHAKRGVVLVPINDIANVLDVAKYFIANTDKKNAIDYPKLQMLCAYAQAYQLALNGRRLFNASLEAGVYGPMVKKLYDTYCSSGTRPLSTSVKAGEESRRPFSDEQLFVLETVNGYYGGYTASHLQNMSREDFPGKFKLPLGFLDPNVGRKRCRLKRPKVPYQASERYFAQLRTLLKEGVGVKSITSGQQEPITDRAIIKKFAQNKVILAIKEAFQCPPTR